MAETDKQISQRLQDAFLEHLRRYHGAKAVKSWMLESGLGTLSEHGNTYHSPNFAEDSAVVKLTGAQSVAGVKTFTSIPVLPASDPTADNEAARKAYVDLHILKSLLTTRGDMIRRGASAPERFAKGTSGKFLKAGASDPDWQWDEGVIPYVIDGGGSVISTGYAGGLEVPFDCFVTGWTITAQDGNSGAIVVDVWRDTYANFPPTVADTIAGSEKPTITATGNKGQDLSLSTWTQALTKGDWLSFNVDSVTTLTRVTVSLRVDKYRAA